MVDKNDNKDQDNSEQTDLEEESSTENLEETSDVEEADETLEDSADDSKDANDSEDGIEADEESEDDSSDESDDVEAADEPEVFEEDDESEDDSSDESADKDDEKIVTAGEGGDEVVPPAAADGTSPEGLKGYAAFFDLPDDLMIAASHTRESEYEDFEAYSPFPIHGMDDAMGLGRSWIPWVTFGAGTAGLLIAISLQFGTMTFDWPMIIGGKPYAPWPSFVPIMFELTVLLAGCTTALVMLIAAGCFKKPFIIDREITQDRFALWISADDEAFEADEVHEFMKSLDPVEIRPVTKGA